MKSNETGKITFIAAMIGLVTVASYFGVRIPWATGGYTHLGTLAALIIAIKFGKTTGAIAGGVGMTIFDILSPYYIWWPGTLIVRLIMGYVVGWIAYDIKKESQGTNLTRNIIAILVGMVIMLIGYYLYEALWLTSWREATASIFGNVLQFVIGMAAIYVVPKLIKYEEATS